MEYDLQEDELIPDQVDRWIKFTYKVHKEIVDDKIRGYLMNIAFYSREQIAYRSAGAAISITAGSGTASVETAPAENNLSTGDQVQLSDTSKMALQAQTQEVAFSGGWNDIVLDHDGHMVAEASYNMKFSSKFESLNVSLTFTAESLGLSKKDFAAFGGKPIEIKLDLYQQSLDYIHERKLTVTQKNRTADEVISDIAKSLRDVFKQKGDKSVKLHLDVEAIQALLSNADTHQLIDDIVALIGIINHTRMYGGPRDHYDIYVSGKGKPKLDYKEDVELNIEGSQISLKITILPPEEEVAVEDHTSQQTVIESEATS